MLIFKGDALKCKSSKYTAIKTFQIEFNESDMINYIIPYKFVNIIDFIEGLTQKTYKKARINSSQTNNPDLGFVGREVIIELYNITENIVQYDNISVCSVEYQNNQGFLQSNLLNNQLINSEIPRLVNKNNIVGNKFGTDTESISGYQMMADIAENVTLQWDETNWLYSFAVNL